MTPTSARLKLLAGINEQMDRCERDQFTGELLIHITLNQGGVRQAKAERVENLIKAKKVVDNLEIYRLTGK